MFLNEMETWLPWCPRAGFGVRNLDSYAGSATYQLNILSQGNPREPPFPLPYGGTIIALALQIALEGSDGIVEKEEGKL